MDAPPDRFFVYRTSAGATSLPFGHTEWGATRSLDARRGGRQLGLKAFRQGNLLSESIRDGCLLLLLKHSAAKKPPRREVVYPYADNGMVVERTTSDLIEATRSLLAEINQYGEGFAVEHGMLINLRDPVLGFVPPHRYATELPREEIAIHIDAAWSQYCIGLRFPNDPHCYSFWSAYGMLDRIKHAPDTHEEIERVDFREYATRLHPVNCGHLDFFSQVHDLGPLISGLLKLQALLEQTTDQTVGVMAVPGEKQRQGYLDAGLSLKHFWPIPES